MDQTTTATSGVQAKRYNVTGAVSELATSKMNDGVSQRVSFKLLRDGKKPLTVVGFAEKAEQFLAQSFSDGSTVKLFGIYEDRKFVGDDGEQVKTKRFKFFWSGLPTVKEPAAEGAVEEPFGIAA